MKRIIMRHRKDPNGDLLHYRECGLDNVWLAGGFVLAESPFGRTMSIKNLDELFNALAVHLVEQSGEPAAKELRYLRQHLGMTQAQLGALLGLSEQQVARWEKDQSEIGAAAWRLLRLLILERTGMAIKVELQLKAASSPPGKRPRRVVARRGARWQTEIAA
jgi:DNA-binding transcriptional regulator YiaG